MKKMLAFLFLAVASSYAFTVYVPAYGQCGGQGYTGPKTCIPGTTCTRQNDFYYQCIPKS